MKTIILFLGVLVASLAQAQTNENQVISSSGGEGQSQGTQISWTIGESVVETKGSGPILSIPPTQLPIIEPNRACFGSVDIGSFSKSLSESHQFKSILIPSLFD